VITAIYRLQFAYSFSTVCGAGMGTKRCPRRTMTYTPDKAAGVSGFTKVNLPSYPHLSRVLHNKTGRHGDGAGDLPVAHRSPRWPALGFIRSRSGIGV
jgi:hypothetical protein